MFLVKSVRDCSVFVILCVGMSFGLENQTVSPSNLTLTFELVNLVTNRTGASNVLPESRPLVFRRLLNETMEKVQVVDGGVVTKSALLPILKHESTGNFPRNENELKAPGINESVNKTSAQNNLIVKNGKKYRLVKVRKQVKNAKDNSQKNQAQRRTFLPSYHNYLSLPKLLSILPVKWMTREKKNETEPEVRSENATQWSKILPFEKESLGDGLQSSEKIKKLINLFTIVKFDNGDCYVDGVKGTCLHQTECQAKGGTVLAGCAEDLGVCCYSERTCGEASSESSIYFVNEGFPETSTTAPKVCTLTVEKTDADVKQLRLDFLTFQLRDPINGTCLNDRLVISGQDINSVVPEICGVNTGQHVYVDVEDSNGPYNINIIMMGEYFGRNFRIKVTQMKMDDVLLAPKNCLQYYTEPTGFVQTFNYRRDINENIEEVVNGYFNNLNYAICIKKLRSFCSVSYENEEFDAIQPTFQLVNVDENGEKLLPPRQAGAETFDCPDDYLVVNGIRLCGEKLNDASVEIDFTRNHPVTDTSNGPFILSVRTDSTISGRGFHLKYVQNPCAV